MPIGTFLNGRNPTTLRGLLFLALSETGTPVTFVATTDSGGGATKVWSAGTATECRIDPVGGRNMVNAGRIDERSTHIVTVPIDAIVATGDRFAITGRGTFEVTQTRDRTSPLARQFEVVAI